jgi:hypothetical protein
MKNRFFPPYAMLRDIGMLRDHPCGVQNDNKGAKGKGAKRRVLSHFDIKNPGSNNYDPGFRKVALRNN